MIFCDFDWVCNQNYILWREHYIFGILESIIHTEMLDTTVSLFDCICYDSLPDGS